jgi:hypothetical protein
LNLVTGISNASLRVILKIEVLPQASEQLTGFCRRLGMTQVATTSRLVEWLCAQQDVVQAAVLGLYPEDLRAELPSMILKRMAVGNKK